MTERWGHGKEKNPERWSGMFLTRAEAIEDGRAEYRDSESFWIARGNKCRTTDFLPNVDDILQTMADNADDIIEIMATNAGDNAGEVADDWPNVSKEAQVELTELLAVWAREHAPCEFWIADGHEEEIDRIADVATIAAEMACSHCQKSELVSQYRNADTAPVGWFIIDEVGDCGGVFCSTACVDAFREQEEETDRQIAERWRCAEGTCAGTVLCGIRILGDGRPCLREHGHAGKCEP